METAAASAPIGTLNPTGRTFNHTANTIRSTRATQKAGVLAVTRHKQISPGLPGFPFWHQPPFQGSHLQHRTRSTQLPSAIQSWQNGSVSPFPQADDTKGKFPYFRKQNPPPMRDSVLMAVSLHPSKAAAFRSAPAHRAQSCLPYIGLQWIQWGHGNQGKGPMLTKMRRTSIRMKFLLINKTCFFKPVCSYFPQLLSSHGIF